MTKKADDKDESKGEALEAVAGVGSAAVAAVSGPAIATIAAGVPALLVWASDRLSEARRAAANKRVECWLENVAAAMEFADGAAVQAELDEHIHEDWARDGLLESFRQLMDCLSEDAIPALGRLTAEYLAAKRPPDTFFRSLAGRRRLACILDSGVHTM